MSPPHFSGRRRLPAWATLMPLLALVACAGPQTLRVSPGQTEADMIAAMGQPTGRYPLPQGAQRVEYAKGPYGRVTFMIDLDASGRVKAADQVLTRQNFGKVVPGMSTQEVLMLLGRPGDRAPEFQNRETWSWRYETYDCLWARITIGPEGRTRSGVAYLEDPRCDASQ